MNKNNVIADLSKFPPHEFSIDIVETVDGGYRVDWHISGKTKRYLKRKAAKEGRTLEEWIEHHLMPEFSGQPLDSDPR